MENFRETYKQQRDDLQKRNYEILLRDVPKSITRTKAFIHRMGLSSAWGYQKIVDAIGPIYKMRDLKKSDGYTSEYHRNFPDFTMQILLSPKDNLRKKTFINLTPNGDIPIDTHKKFLVWLNSKINLTVSNVEYAIDLYTKKPADVRRLFFLIRRYAFIAGQSDIETFGGQMVDEQLNEYMNHALRIGKDHRIYERGRDDTKEGKGWKPKHLDRVRLEYTARAKTRKFKKATIRQLADFIDNPKFEFMVGDRWRFKDFFKGPFPKFWEDFTHEDKKGNAGTMFSEITAARGPGINERQYYDRPNVPIFHHMKPIADVVNSSIADFDKSWLGPLLEG